MGKRNPLNVGILEMLSNILGDTERGLIGSEIHRLLLQAKIDDISYKETYLAKRKKLFNAFANFQNKNRCADNILLFIQQVLTPSRFVGCPE